MGRIEEIIAERRRLADRYKEKLQGDERIQLPFEPQGYLHVYQSYCVRLLKNPQLEVMNGLAQKDVASRRILAIHLEQVYKDSQLKHSLIESERASKETILLPMFVGLTDAEQDEVVEALKIALD